MACLLSAVDLHAKWHVVSAVPATVSLKVTHQYSETGAAEADPVESSVAAEERLWNSLDGPLRFSIDELPAELQLLHGLLNRLKECDDQDVVAQLLACLQLLVLHGECMQRAARDQPGFHAWCQQNLVLQQLWHVLCADNSQAAETAVPLLLHAVTLAHGADVFWRIIERQFQSTEWRVRFMAVEQATVLARFVSPSLVAQCGSAVLSPLSHVFSYLIRSVDDAFMPIAQKVHTLLDTIPDNGIRVICHSLETQFDSVILDRPLVLRTISQLFTLLPWRRVLDWAFFSHRFDTLIIETQLSLQSRGEMCLPRDVHWDEAGRDLYLRRLNRAQVALSAARHDKTQHRTLSASIGAKLPYKRAMSAPLMAVRSERNDILKHSYSRQISAPVLKRKLSKFSAHPASHQMEGGRNSAQNLAATVSAGTDSIMPLVYRHMDSMDGDRETCHLLIDLLMRFLAKPSPACVGEERQWCKAQHQTLKHLAMMLAYNQNDRTFFMSPPRLRSTASFNAFLAQLWRVLDGGAVSGATAVLLSLCVPVLLYGAAPGRCDTLHWLRPGYSLWHLERHQRHDWLQTLLVIVYKHDLSEPSLSKSVVALCRVTLNTLAALTHSCRQSRPATLQQAAATAAAASATVVGEYNIHRVGGGGSPPVTVAVVSSDSDMSSPPPFSRHHRHLQLTPSCTAEVPLPDSRLTAELDGAGNDAPVGYGGKSDAQSCGISQPDVQKISSNILSPQTVGCEVSDLPAVGSSTGHVTLPTVTVRGRRQPGSAKVGSKLSQFEHSMSLDIVPLAAARAESGASSAVNVSQRTHSIAVPQFELLPPSVATGDAAEESGSAERSLFGRLTHVFSRQNSQGVGVSEVGSVARLVSSLQLGLSVVGDVRTLDTSTAAATSAAVSSAAAGTAVSDSSSPDDTDATGRQQLAARAKRQQLRLNALDVTPAIDADSAARRQRPDNVSSHHEPACDSVKLSCLRVGDDCVTERCDGCGRVRECYSEQEVGLCVVVLSTFIHRQPSLAAPMLPDIIKVAASLASQQRYSWQCDSSYHLSGSANSVARQFLRCVLHRLSGYNMALKLFQLDLDVETTYLVYRALAQCLADFVEYNMASPVLNLLEILNQSCSMPSVSELLTIFHNMCVYLEHVPLETGGALFAPLLPPLEQLLRRLLPFSQLISGGRWLLSLMTAALRIPAVSSHKSLMEPFCKLISVHIQHWPLDYCRLVDTCQLCSRVFVRERERFQLARVIVSELVQAVKFKSCLPAANLMLLLAFVVQDCGGVVPPECDGSFSVAPATGASSASATSASPAAAPTAVSAETATASAAAAVELATSGGLWGATGGALAADCMRAHLPDVLDFLADVHAMSRVQSQAPSLGPCSDSLGSCVKSALAQYAALELARAAPGAREQRNLVRHVPWLFIAPSPLNANQQGPKEFIECVSHMRMLSWLLLGSMTQLSAGGAAFSTPCQPVPGDVSCHIADHVQLVLAGFVELSKTSVLHMSSLFHAFILCQLWTVYLDQINGWQGVTAAGVAAAPPLVAAVGAEPPSVFAAIVVDFWAKVTPAILQLMSHSRVLSDMVSLHFVSLLEGLSEYHSASYTRLMPIWNQVFLASGSQIPSHLRVRLENCDTHRDSHAPDGSVRQLLWLRRVQFKLGQIEMQSSAATHFYTV